MNFFSSSTNAEVLGFVKAFEWSTGCAKALEMKPRIEGLLITTNKATDKQEAEIKYQRLFLHVFKLLCQEGTKRLTPGELDEQLALPTLSAQDQETLSYMKCVLASLEARMSVAEKDIEANKQSIETMYPVVQKLVKDHGIDTNIQYTPIKPIIDIPPLVSRASDRRETVSQIARELNEYTWIDLKGTVGTGKTQLAILIAQNLGNCKAWICFSGKKNEALCGYLDRSIELIAKHPISESGRSRFRIACESMKSGDLIVLDDVTSLHKNQDLSTRLLLLLEECTCHGIKIISTGTITQPAGFCGSADDRFRILDVPPFTEGEISEVLQAYGASPTNAEKWSKSVNTLTLGHPVLIVAVARYFQSVAWQISYEQFDSLFVKQDYAKAVNPETVRRLLDTVEDPDCRKFLYRLNLVIYSFTTDDAKAVASIKPPVQRPIEKLTLLDGLWIQRMSGDSYMLSPLVKRLGSGDIPLQRQKKINCVLGLRVLSRRHLNQWDAFSAVNYFKKAEAHHNAMVVLIQALHSIAEKEEISDDAFLGIIWKDMPLPTNTDMGLRIFLRSLQLAVNRKLGRDVKFLISDLCNLIEIVEFKDCWTLFHAVFEIIRYKEFYNDNWKLVHKVISKAIKSFPEAIIADGTKIASICKTEPDGFIWLVVPNITTVDQLNDWICLLESLPAEALKKAFAIPEADQCCIDISHSVWIEEAKKDEGARRWKQVLDCFDKLANRSRRLGLLFLWACANRAKMIIHAEYIDDFESAQTIAERTLAEGPEDPRIRLLMKEYIGQQYYHERKHEAAQPWLEGAIEIDIDLNPFGKLRSLIYLGAILGKEDPNKALEFVQNAVDLANTSVAISETDLARALSELAVAQWLLSKNVSEVFSSFDQAAERLFACRKDDIFWKALFVRFAHVTVYFQNLALEGEPPTLANGEQYAEPFRGMFFTSAEETLAERFEEKTVWACMAELASFASATKNDKRAAYWAERSLDMARSRGQSHAIALLINDLVPHLLCNNEYAQVLDMALECSSAGVASIKLRKENKFSIEMSIDIPAVLGPKPSDLWSQAEQESALVGLLPVAFRILTVALDNLKLAETHAQEVVAICKQISITASSPAFWLLSAELFSDLFSETIKGKDLIKKAEAAKNKGHNTLTAIGYIFTALKSDYGLKSRAYAQLAAIPFFKEFSKRMPSIYRLLFLPFILNYWQKMFKEGRCLFFNPKEIEKSLEKAGSISEEERAQYVLKTVAWGLGIRLSDEEKKWINVDKPKE